MDIQAPKKRISKRALPVWRITGFLNSLILWLLLIGGGAFIIFRMALSKWWLVGGITVVGVITILITFVIPMIRWKRWRYEVSEQEIELQYGVFIITRTLIPMIRVQHVDTSQGPILRKYGLATITVSTAATTHEIPAIDLEEADELRRSISALARVAEEDV